MAHIRQSRPDSGLGFQVKVLTTFQVDPSSRGSGMVRIRQLYTNPSTLLISQLPRGGQFLMSEVPL